MTGSVADCALSSPVKYADACARCHEWLYIIALVARDISMSRISLPPRTMHTFGYASASQACYDFWLFVSGFLASIFLSTRFRDFYQRDLVLLNTAHVAFRHIIIEKNDSFHFFCKGIAAACFIIFDRFADEWIFASKHELRLAHMHILPAK